MRKYKAKLIRIGRIAGIFYKSKNLSKTLVIYGLGAPVIPDMGLLQDAPVIMDFDVDLLVPDYIGYGRSDGVFTPLNCINTFLNLYQKLTKGCLGINYYENLKIELKYERIIFIGRSFGGTYVPLLPRYNPKITELGIIYPAVDNKSSGDIKGEESNEDFMRAMKFDGYHYLYRGISSKIWKKHLVNQDGLSPMDNIEFTSKAKLFIAHGEKDTCINFTKSVVYYNKILDMFPEKKEQFKLNLYPNSGHTFETSNPACRDFLNWLRIDKHCGQ